jgi:hypothetical protein
MAHGYMQLEPEGLAAKQANKIRLKSLGGLLNGIW